MGASRIHILAGLAFVSVIVSSCGSNPDNPVTPHADSVPKRMVTIVGTPRVKGDLRGSLIENPLNAALGGTFSLFFTDSTGVRTFLPDVRLAGIPMHEERDPLGEPSRYTLDTDELPAGYEIGDTLLVEVVDGGTITPPFTYVLVPSYVTLPADSTVLHRGSDLTLPFTGVVERVLVTFTDAAGVRVLYNLQVENYSGQTEVFIRGSDLNVLALGYITLGTNTRDIERFVLNGAYLQSFEMNTTQNRALRLDP